MSSLKVVFFKVIMQTPYQVIYKQQILMAFQLYIDGTLPERLNKPNWEVSCFCLSTLLLSVFSYQSSQLAPN
jgi:hypothetical protein